MKYYTLEEVAELHRVSVHTVRNRLTAGRYPHAKKNGKWTLPECCVDGHDSLEPRNNPSGVHGINVPSTSPDTGGNHVEVTGALSPVNAEIAELDRQIAKARKDKELQDKLREVAELSGAIVDLEAVAAFRQEQAKLERDIASHDANVRSLDRELKLHNESVDAFTRAVKPWYAGAIRFEEWCADLTGYRNELQASANYERSLSATERSTTNKALREVRDLYSEKICEVAGLLVKWDNVGAAEKRSVIGQVKAIHDGLLSQFRHITRELVELPVSHTVWPDPPPEPWIPVMEPVELAPPVDLAPGAKEYDDSEEDE